MLYSVRVAREEAKAHLTQIVASGILEQDCVNLIKFDAIQRELGGKWLRRREQVWDHAEKLIQDRSEATNLHVRVGETAFIVCSSGVDPSAAQVMCARIVRDLLNFFLGSSSHLDIQIMHITQLSDQAMTVRPIKLNSGTLLPEDTSELQSAPELQEAVPPTTVVISSNGAPLSISFSVEHVFKVQGASLAALRIKVAITDQLTGKIVTQNRLMNMDFVALTAIDEKTSEFALSLLHDPEFRNVGVFVPISLQTATNVKSRNLILKAFARNPEQCKSRLVVELFNMGRGTPSHRVVEAISMLNPYMRGVFARLAVDDDALHIIRNTLSGSRVNGIVVDTGFEQDFNRALVTKVLGFGNVALGIAPIFLVGPVPSEGFVDICRVAGVTHVAFPPARGATLADERPPELPRTAVGSLQQLIYISRAKLDPENSGGEILQAIVLRSNVRNKESYITGLLVYRDGWFVQVLEGARNAVAETMQRIYADSRHENVQVIYTADIQERDFPNWSMTGAILRDEHLSKLDWKSEQPSMDALSAERARSLLCFVAQELNAEQ